MFNFLNFRKKKEVEVSTSIITLDDLETKNFIK